MNRGAAKSFRAAAERIVLQESSRLGDVLHLLSPGDLPLRTIANEQDAWDARLASIAALGEYDAVACFAAEPLRLAHSHNVRDPNRLEGAVGEAIDEVMRYRAALQLRSPVALADGRIGTTLLVAPLRGVARAEGVLVAVRVGRDFVAADAVIATRVSELLAIEVMRAVGEWQDAHVRAEALALFELARLGLGRGELGERVQSVLEMLSGSLGHDMAQIWLLRGGGSLRVLAAYPRDPLLLEIARPRDQTALARALGGETVVVDDSSLRFWVRRTTRDLIVVPLRDEGDILGLLVLGRWREAHAHSALDMARVSADFIARIVASDGRAQADAATSDQIRSYAEDSLTAS
jgi:hypothetical protein